MKACKERRENFQMSARLVPRCFRRMPTSKRSQPIARSCTRTSRSTITADFSPRFLRSVSVTPRILPPDP